MFIININFSKKFPLSKNFWSASAFYRFPKNVQVPNKSVRQGKLAKNKLRASTAIRETRVESKQAPWKNLSDDDGHSILTTFYHPTQRKHGHEAAISHSINNRPGRKMAPRPIASAAILAFLASGEQLMRRGDFHPYKKNGS